MVKVVIHPFNTGGRKNPMYMIGWEDGKGSHGVTNTHNLF